MAIMAPTATAEPARYQRCPSCLWGTAHDEALNHHMLVGACGVENDDKLRMLRRQDRINTGIEWGGR